MVTKDTEIFKEVEFNQTFKNELTAYNNGETKKVESITAKTTQFKNIENGNELPVDLKTYMSEGPGESALIQFAGIYGSKIDLSKLKGNISSNNWDHDYLEQKLHEVVNLPSIKSDLMATTTVLSALLKIPEIKKEATELLLESLKELSASYKHQKENGADSQTLSAIQTQIDACLVAANENSDEKYALETSSSNNDESAEAVVVSKAARGIASDVGSDNASDSDPTVDVQPSNDQSEEPSYEEIQQEN